MEADAHEMRRSAWTLLLALSFVPLAVKAAGYATIGSYLPLVVLLVFAALVAGASAGPWARTRAVRVWASALVLWGVVRIALGGLLLTTDIGEVHPVDQVTPWYLLLSIAHVVLGVVLFRRREEQVAVAPGASAPGP